MDVAASLLLNTNRSIKEISFDMGYSNPFHFSRSFSRYADMSPRVYREQYFRANPTQYESKVLGGPG
jgi:AraC-like DNA-binding protein